MKSGDAFSPAARVCTNEFRRAAASIRREIMCQAAVVLIVLVVRRVCVGGLARATRSASSDGAVDVARLEVEVVVAGLTYFAVSGRRSGGYAVDSMGGLHRKRRQTCAK